MIESRIKEVGSVPFPEFTGERVYMVPFQQEAGLPAHLRRWQPTVDAMMQGITADREIYLMVDQSFVEAGKAQRRPGLHVDGNWIASEQRHGGPRPPGHAHGSYPDEAIILASDVVGCRAFVGAFDGLPREGGDCSHMDPSATREVVLRPNTAYAGNVTMVHESLPLSKASQRTLVRLNVPGVKI